MSILRYLGRVPYESFIKMHVREIKKKKVLKRYRITISFSNRSRLVLKITFD